MSKKPPPQPVDAPGCGLRCRRRRFYDMCRHGRNNSRCALRTAFVHMVSHALPRVLLLYTCSAREREPRPTSQRHAGCTARAGAAGSACLSRTRSAPARGESQTSAVAAAPRHPRNGARTPRRAARAIAPHQSRDFARTPTHRSDFHVLVRQNMRRPPRLRLASRAPRRALESPAVANGNTSPRAGSREEHPHTWAIVGGGGEREGRRFRDTVARERRRLLQQFEKPSERLGERRASLYRARHPMARL